VKSKYEVCTPLRHDHVDYAEGEEIELEDKQAKELLALGAIARMSKAVEPTPKTGGAKTIATKEEK